jgi:hypothetical protein
MAWRKDAMGEHKDAGTSRFLRFKNLQKYLYKTLDKLYKVGYNKGRKGKGR